MGDSERPDLSTGKRLGPEDLAPESAQLRARGTLYSRDLHGLRAVGPPETSRESLRARAAFEISPAIRDLIRRARRIEPAPTTVTAFVGVGSGEPFRIDGPGGLAGRTPVSAALAAAVESYFVAGGEDAWIVPVAALTPDTAAAAASGVDPDVSLIAVVDDPAPGPKVTRAVSEALRGRDLMLLIEGPWPDAATARSAAGSGSARALCAAGEDAAVFWPRIWRTGGGAVTPLGAVAGTIVANDRARGVFSAPAGERGRRAGAGAPAVEVAGALGGELAEASINPIRVLPQLGTTIWGARTLSPSPEWRYIPVRRGAQFIERSLHRGLAWTASAADDERLWARVRASAEEFLLSLWRRGALAGSTPEQAFFVRCGLGTTMTAADVAAGRLICLVGIAPLRPSEFLQLRVEPRTVA